MTDAFTEQSQFETPSRFTGGSAFVDLDAQRTERNLDAINLVEQSWRLPAVPDLVKMDLATSQSASPESLIEALSGIDEDLHRPTADDEQQPTVPGQQLSGVDQARIILAAQTSNPPPQRVSSEATERFKLRAIDAGLLDMEPSRVDASWSPEMNRIRGELAWDDYNRSMRGDRPGAMPFSRAVGILGDLTSPAGLLSFATDLDLLPDFQAIGEEFSTWGDKWRKVADSDGPFDLAKNLVDALTGPIDDIAFPIINVGLLFSGIGAVTNGARVGWMGRNLARAGASFGGLWGESRIGRAIIAGTRGIGEGLSFGARANLDELARPSMLAERLMRGARDVERGTEAWGKLGAGTRFAARNGDLLAQWRALAPVAGTKRVVQQGMRLGLVSYAEDAFPGYQGGGASLSDIPAVSRAADRLYEMGMDPKFMPLELMFAPYNIFAPGTFFRRAGQGAGTIGRAGTTAGRALGTSAGRAVAGGLAGTVAGVVAGDDAGDIAKGAAIGAVGAAALPAVGRALEVQRIHQGLTGALAGAGAGLVLGDSPEDVALGALAGTGLIALPNNVRRRFYNQVGVSGLDRLIRGVGHAMVRTNYGLIEKDTDIAVGFNAKMRRLLNDSPDDLQQWNIDAASYGVVGALAKRSYGKADEGTRELAAAAIGFDYTTFSIDWIAHAQASAVTGARRQKHAFHMARNKLTNQLRPIDLDRPVDDLIEDVAKIIAWTDTRGARGLNISDAGNVPRFAEQQGDALYRVRRRQNEVVAELRANPERAMQLAEEHNNQIGDTITQLFEHKNFPKADDMAEFGAKLGPSNLNDQWAGMDMGARSALYANHGGWSNFGDFREFTQATNEIRNARLEGLFDAATLKPVVTRRGRLRAPKAGTGADFFDPSSTAAQKALSDMIIKGVDPAKLGNLKVTPWAQASEAGRVTVARTDFITKQQVEELADKLADVLSMQRLLPKLAAGWQDAVAGTRAVSEMDVAELRTTLQAIVGAGVTPKSAQQIRSFARHHELSLADLQASVNRLGDELLNSTDWTRYGFDHAATDAEGRLLNGVDALQRRHRELKDKVPFAAAELDMDGLARYYDEAGDTVKAQRVRDLTRDAEARGYKHVYGVEFLSPEDVAFKMPTFADATGRHMNAVTLGNWFGRRQPIEAWARDDRRRRLVLSEELSRVGKDLDPAGKEADGILDRLEGWLKREQDAVAEDLRLAHAQGGIGEKTSLRIRSSLMPVRLDDVGGFSKRGRAIQEEMRTLGYSEDEAKAVWKAVARFRQSDFAEVGLYGIEAELRNKNQAAGFLKMLAGTRYGDSVLARAAGQAATGAAVGALAAGDDASFEDRLKAAVLGGAVGAGVSAAVRPKMIAAAEGWRYGYIADAYARLRDSMRFTISPIFDISRFTEGAMLSQTAVPLRRADGSRLAMPVLAGGLTPIAAASPAGLRRRLARAAMRGDKTLTKAGAKREALAQYERFVDEFGAAARGAKDFDRDAIDAAGRWYRQVGIVGFSPTDWMATAYAYLRGEKFAPDAAYKAAREMYMYGSTGRSAAELSVNMVFFPFSFQKKALGHIGKWLNDDLGRSIILHDALKAYEHLDERYDLDKFWKDHVPYLQQLQRLNMFAYGLSPGRFGGINSQLFEGVGKVAWNAFIPVGAKIQDASAASELQDLGKQLLPVWNDINWMLHDTREVAIPVIQGAFGPMAAQSYRAQVRDGWTEYNQIRDDYEVALAEKGYTLADFARRSDGTFVKPWLAEAALEFEARVTELAGRYPAWFEARTEIPGNRIALEMEKDLWLKRAASGDTSVTARQMEEMQQFIDGLLNRMELVHGTRDPELAGPQIYSLIQEKAIELAERNPRFRSLWNRFWRRDFGLIDEPMRLD